jgi:hypothetical protein
MAERGGFEPPVELVTLRRFSKPLLSTTQPPLREVSEHFRSMVTHKPVRGETDCPGARKRPVNVKCSPVRVSTYVPCYSQGDVHGRIRFKRHRNRQNLCDWILGRAGNDVKGKTPTHFVSLKPIIPIGLAVLPDSDRLWKRCVKGLKPPLLSSLRIRTVRTYLPSSPSVIIESGSTG